MFLISYNLFKLINVWMYEWMNEWMNELINEWTNK